MTGLSYKMKVSIFWACHLIVIGLTLQSMAFAAPEGPVPASFFGLQMHKPAVMGQPWPSVPFGAGRLWDSGVSWAEVNTAKGAYDWSLLDKWLAMYHEHGIDDLLYTFGRVPHWVTSKPNDKECAFHGEGQCDPPRDLALDGSGSDQSWRDFVTAIATHSKDSRTAHIRYWELWNEPHNANQWKGTNAQLLRMARDARQIILSIDRNAIIVSPSSGMRAPKHQEWMARYLHDGGGEQADIIAFHGYVHTGRPHVYPQAADILEASDALRRMMSVNGLDKTIFDTEASWGRATTMGFEDDEDFEAGFLAQFYLLHWSAGIKRFYWYAWNNEEFGTLWSQDAQQPSGKGHVHKAGTAYEQVYRWMVGATMTPCAETAEKVWTCTLTRSGGYEALAVWSTAGDQAYAAPQKFKTLCNLSGHTSTMSARKVKIGFQPILLQNQ